ncbi:S-adenosylmethionine:tRNA ribosyltransferase-isomerase [Bacteroides sedimenti]|uniref:S-adenosylmethionine:tRNA ribosyltransferase-isomerase n=2 Tax=Bacteroides sedimenti TaxID=2136147 RepID=A0ABM8IGC1_9BACE
MLNNSSNITNFAEIDKEMMKETKHIKISEFNYPLPDERIAKFPLSVRDQSKLLVYNHGEISETQFTSLPDLIPADSLMIFNNTKVIQARLHFRKETGALIEVFCLEPISPNDYQLSFQQTEKCSWLCMIGNLKKWKEGVLSREITVKGMQVVLKAIRGEARGTSHWVNFSWNNKGVTFAEILEVVGELPIPPYLNRETEESDKETYQTVYSKVEGSVAAPTAGLHFTENVMQDLKDNGVELEELTLHVGAGTFKPVKSEEIADHEMHTEYISVSRTTIEKLIAHKGNAIAVGTTSVRTLESLYHIGVTLSQNLDANEEDLHVNQWQPYSDLPEMSSEEALQQILQYLDRNGMEALHSSTQIIIAPGYQYRIVKAMVTNFHQPQSTLLLLVSAFVNGDWKKIYQYALNHDFRFLSYGDSSLLIP